MAGNRLAAGERDTPASDRGAKNTLQIGEICARKLVETAG
jgi:hypothetical protein